MPTPTGIIGFSLSTPAPAAGNKLAVPQTDSGSPVAKWTFEYDAGYDVIFPYVGKPPNAVTIQLVCFARAINFAALFAGSVGHCATNPTSTATYTLNKNGTSCGTVVVSTGGVFSFTSAGSAAVSFAAGDVLSILTPATDATLSDVTFSLKGTKT